MTLTPSKSPTTMYLIFVASTFRLFIAIACSPGNITETELTNFTTPDEMFTNFTEADEKFANFTATDEEFTNFTTPNTKPHYLNGKHESLSVCGLSTLGSGDYKLFPNGTLYVDVYNNLTLNESMYYLLNDSVSFCMPNFPNPDEDPNFDAKDHLSNTSLMTLVGLIISMICLFLHLVAFCLVPDLRNLPGWNLAALCISLLSSYILLITSNQVRAYPDVCFAVAVLSHFFLLSSLLWMSIVSYGVFVSLLRATGSFRVSSTQFKKKKFGLYSLCAFGVAFVFAFLGVLADVLKAVPKGYRPNFKEMCWFSQKTPLLIFFAAPAIALTCLNFIFFILSSYTIHANKMKCDQNNQQNNTLRRNLMYFRLSVIMGVTWILGIVAATVNQDWLWYLFVALNTLQGLFIFLAFTCSKKVKKYIRLKFIGPRRLSEQTLSPTFQSYCYYASSIEKDLDKIVDNNKEKTHTIMIHL